MMFRGTDVPDFFNQSPTGGHLDCFQLFISSVAKNNFIHTCFAHGQVYLTESSYRGISVSNFDTEF